MADMDMPSYDERAAMRDKDPFPRTIPECLDELTAVLSTINGAEKRKRELLKQIEILNAQYRDRLDRLINTPEEGEVAISRGERY